MAQNITVEPVDFSEAVKHLKESIAGDSATLELQCKNKTAQCWKIKNGQAYMLTRNHGLELVICCMEGEKLYEITAGIIEAAKKSGFTSIRFHTKRPALARLIKADVELVEYVYRKVL